jgi:Xaa-Pro dipeptidase
MASGQSVLFAPRLPPDYAVWMGEIKPLSYFKVFDVLNSVFSGVLQLWFHIIISLKPVQDRYKVDLVFYVDEIAQVLQDKFSEHGKPLLFLLYGKSSDSGNYSKPATFQVRDI